MPQSITRQDIVKAIQTLATRKKRNWLSLKEFLSESEITFYQLQKNFIRWNNAVLAAGLCPLNRTGRPDQTRGMTEDQLLQIAVDMIQQLGRRTISQAEFTKHAGISCRPIHRLFGTWKHFAQKAGLQLHPAHKTKIPDEALFQEFFRLKSELEHIPSYQELQFATYSSGTFEKRFGTYSMFRIRAMQYGIQHGLIEPEIAEQEISMSSSRPEQGVSYQPLNDRPVLGRRIDFRGLLHAPVNELGVVYLFGMLSQELGFVVESVQSGFPDCEAKRQLSNNRWQAVRIEFEFRSSNFHTHGHDLSKCDLIVCWEHNWRNCPIEVISLSDFVKRNRT